MRSTSCRKAFKPSSLRGTARYRKKREPPIAAPTRVLYLRMPAHSQSLLQLGCQELADRLPPRMKYPSLDSSTSVCETQKVESLRLPFNRFPRRSAAQRPNSIERVFSGCNSSPNFRVPANPHENFSASSRRWNLVARAPQHVPVVVPPSSAMPHPQIPPIVQVEIGQCPDARWGSVRVLVLTIRLDAWLR